MNRIIVITGGTSGLGYQLAKKFHSEGDFVVVVGRVLGDVEKTEEALGVDGLKADVTKDNDWTRLHKYIMEQYGKIDILINNAGGGIVYKPFLEQTLEQIRSTLELNLAGAILGCKHFAPEMVKAGHGTIINIGAAGEEKDNPGLAVYLASKAGLRSFSKALYGELREKGVKVTTVLTGAMDTGFAASCGKEAHKEKIMKPEDAAEAIKALCAIGKDVEISELVLSSDSLPFGTL
ncbi:MAG: SDR family oxidoreductase [Bacilli bacterium]|jgi:short-subunit dehydrogenase|nr:SDR family oxidoreductase [Bacilli bacterium]